MGAKTMTVDSFADIYRQGYVYRTGNGVNLGNTVVERNFTFSTNGQATTVTQTGLGIDCSGLATRYLWENGYNIPYQTTGQVMPSAGTLAAGASKYFDQVGAADVRPGDLVYFNLNGIRHVGLVQEWDSDRSRGTVFQAGVHAVDKAAFTLTSGMEGTGTTLGFVRPKDEWRQGENASAAEQRLREAVRVEEIALQNYQQTGQPSAVINGTGHAASVSVDDYARRVDVLGAPVSGSGKQDLSGLSHQERVNRITLDDQEFDRVKEEIAAIEAKGKNLNPDLNFGYGQKSPSGTYLGRYQFDKDALAETGYYDKVSGTWTGKDGVKSEADFLSNTNNAQDHALRTRLDQKAEYAVRNDLDTYIGSTVANIGVDEINLMTALHSRSGHVKQFMESDGTNNPKDGAGKPISAYLQKAAASDPDLDAANSVQPPSDYSPYGSNNPDALRTPLPDLGTITHHADGSTIYAGFITGNEASGTLEEGDWVGQTFDKDGHPLGQLILHKDTGQVDFTEVDPTSNTETFRQITKEGKLITEIETDRDTGEIVRIGVLNGYSTTSASEGDNSPPQESEPLSLGDELINQIKLSQLAPPNWHAGTQVADGSDYGGTMIDVAPTPGTSPIDTADPVPSDGETSSTTPTSGSNNLSDSLAAIEPYTDGLNSALSLIQALQQGNGLSAVLAGIGTVNAINTVVNGQNAQSVVPGEIGLSLGALASGLNLLDALNAGDSLGAVTAGTNLASQAAALWAGSLGAEVGNLVSQGLNAEAASLAQAAAETQALSNTLGQVAGVFGIANSLANGDPLGAGIAAITMINPPLGAVLSVARAIFGGLFGGDDGEPPYVWINATGEAHIERTEEGGLVLEAHGTNRHKSTEGTADNSGTEGGQAVASAMNGLLNELQSQIAAHNAANPDAPNQQWALVPERLPSLYYNAPAYYVQWTDADTGEARSIAVSRTNLAEDLMAVAQAAQAVVPQWLADTITEKIEAGDASAWQTPSDNDTDAITTLVVGNGANTGTVLSDADGDGWLESHTWSNSHFYLSLDVGGDGNIEALHDLIALVPGGKGSNNLSWLDANGDQKLDAQDPAFGAIKLWLDVNGDASQTQNETASLTDAGIVAIDFGSTPPALVDAQGKRTELRAAQITGSDGDADWLDHGIAASQSAEGLLVRHEEGGQELYAQVTHDYSGEAGHTQRETLAIDAGDGRLVSEAAPTAALVQDEMALDQGDPALQSPPAATAAARQAAAQPQTQRAGEVRTVAATGVAPQASTREELRVVTEQMIRESENLFIGAGALLTAVAVGAGSAQAAAPEEVLKAAQADGDSATTGFVDSNPAPALALHALTLDELSAQVSAVAQESGTSEAAGYAAFAIASLAVTLPQFQGAVAAVGGGAYVAAATANSATAQDQGGGADVGVATASAVEVVSSSVVAVSSAAVEPAVPDVGALSSPLKLRSTVADGDSAALYQPKPGNDVLDDRREDQAFRVSSALLLANDTAVAANPFLLASVEGAQHGRVEILADGDIAFYPDPDYFGPAGFSYTVRNNYAQTAQGWVGFEIVNENDAPVAQDEGATMAEDTALLIDPALLLANDTDIDNAHGQLAVAAVGGASHGAVVLRADGMIVFTPDADYFGPAGFDYTVADGSGGFSQAHMTLTVANVNDAPVTVGESVAADEDQALLFHQALLLGNDSDIDNSHGQLTIAAVGGASHGSVVLQGDGQVLFTPEADYFGPAGFDYTVADGSGGLTLAHVSLSLANVNDAPTTLGEAADATEDTALLIDPALLLANDTDIDNSQGQLFVASVANASHGTVALRADGMIVFTPAADYFGAAGFDYTVADGSGGFTQAHVDVTVANVNDAPATQGETVAVAEDTVLTFTQAALLANDSDVEGDALAIVAVGGASYGSVSLEGNGDIRFTPAANYFGAAGFDYTVADGNGGLTLVHVNLDYGSVNDASLVGDESVAGKGNVPITFTHSALLANDGDVDGDTLTVTAVHGASHGTVNLQGDGSVLFNPEAGYFGPAGFDYTVSDGAGGTTQGHVNIDLAHANVAPTAVDDGFTGYEDTPFVIAQSSLLANDSDVDNAQADLRIAAVGGAQNGTVALQADGSVVFTPNANYYGAASFSYTVADGDGGETQATAYLTVQSVNDAPVVTGIVAATFCQISAYDPDGNSVSLTYSLETAPVHGFVSFDLNPNLFPNGKVPPGEVLYLSVSGDPYSGADPFSVRVIDESGASTLCWVPTVHTGSAPGGGGGGGGCPIAIDLNHDGVQLVAPDDSRVFADINGDGWRDQIGWVSAEDGLLALDRDGNGRVDGFDEISFAHDLPGTHTDLQGLTAHDSNGDGYLSAADEEWSRFGVWQDANGNGTQEEGEFRSLDDMGVARIGLSGDGDLHVDQGNVVFGYTSVEMTDGTRLQAADVMFAGAGVAYPDAVQSALAGQAVPAAQVAVATADAEIARQALAFIQAAAAAAVEAAPLAFVDAADAAMPVSALADALTAQDQGVPA